MSSHTTGPWHRNIKPATKYNTIFAGRNTHVAHLATQGFTPEEVEANCNLIAAAPDLLEAVKLAIKSHELGESRCSYDVWQAAEDKAIASLKSALAKATGEATGDE